MSAFRSFAIVPAAGHSRRMGAPKLLLKLGDRTLIEHHLGAWQRSRVDQIVVVVRSSDTELAQLVQGDRLERVVPERDPADMKASVQEALRFLQTGYAPQAGDVWLLAPADLPFLSSERIDQLLSRHDRVRPRIILPVTGGRTGHPVLVPWDFAEAVFQLGPDEGVRDLFGRFPVERVESKLAATCERDVDNPNDYQAALEWMRRGGKTGGLE